MLNFIYCPRHRATSQRDIAELVSALQRADEDGHVDVVGSTHFVGLLDYALHVCRTRGGHFRRKLLLTPADLDFVLR
jgi:hypothetical protein